MNSNEIFDMFNRGKLTGTGISFNDISELNVDKLPLLEKLLIDNTKIVNINLNENKSLFFIYKIKFNN